MAALTERQHAAAAQVWAGMRDRGEALREFSAAGFVVGFSCIGWAQLRQLLPEMADALGVSILQRHRARR